MAKRNEEPALPDEPNSFVHIVSAWAADHQLTLGQLKVDGKSNEITAIPKLLELIDIEGTVITIDTMGTQKNIAEKIVNKKADYILALKGNQSKLHDEVEIFFEQAIKFGDPGVEFNEFKFEEEGRGRKEIRRVYVATEWDFLEDYKLDWKGLSNIICVESEVMKQEKTQNPITFMYLTGKRFILLLVSTLSLMKGLLKLLEEDTN